MRLLLCALFALAALPALAQTERPSRRVVVEVDSASADGNRFEVEIDSVAGDPGRRIVIRRSGAEGDERVVQLRVPDREQIEGLLGAVMDGSMAVFRSDDGETVVERMMDDAQASPETRARMRMLEAQAEAHAQRARESSGAERRAAQTDLDQTLDELFDVRAQARRERADALRKRADALAAQADDIDAALAERQSRRREMIEARRDALMRGDDSDW